MSDKYSIKNKVAIVTGGARGLGKAIVQRLLENGAKVAFCGRTATYIDEQLAQWSKDFPNQVWGKVCDVSHAGQVEELVKDVIARFGDCHVLINNSGFGKETKVWETSEQDWDEVMNTNVKGAFLMCKAVIPHMIKNKEGYVINIASQAALNGYANAGVYCASKFAMVGLGKALQEEVREYGIHVHSLNPALIQSQRVDDEPIDPSRIQNADIADMIVYLLSQPRRLKIDNIGMWGF